jgi:hypothetical protein
MSFALLAGCAPDAPTPGVTCGAGTLELEGVCTAPLGTVLRCGAGTIEADGGCVAAPVAPAPTLTQARLTLLQVRYDLAQPLFLNNSVPVHFGITAASADPQNPVTRTVNVTFSFVEASPADPANPGTCDSAGVDLALTGDGVEQQFDLDLTPTTDCAPWVGAGEVANLAVDFDKGLRLSNLPTGIDYPPVTFSTATQAAALNQLCRTQSGPAPGDGCVYPLSLRPTPLDVDGGALVDAQLESLTPESSVAVVWPATQHPDVRDGGHESAPPSLVVSAVFTLQGRDPNQNMVDTSQLSPGLVGSSPTVQNDLRFGLSDAGLAALDDLPGPATMQYDLAPSGRLTADAWLPLYIDDPADPEADAHLTGLTIAELKPGTDNTFNHVLYIEGAARDAMGSTGAWANETNFTVRGCLVSSFAEGSNAGEQVPGTTAVGGGLPLADCRTFQVTVTRASTPTGSANAYTLDATWGQTVGTANTLQVVGTLSTTNSLDLSGARTDTEGSVDLNGKLGKRFSVELFRAWGKGGALTTTSSSYVDVGITAFGINVFGYQKTLANQTYEVDFKIAKSFEFPGLEFGYGPVSVGIKVSVGGEVGLTPSLGISGALGGVASVPALATASSNGLLKATITPNVALTADVSGGVNILIASAEAVCSVALVDVGFPISATLRWGVTGLDAQQRVTQLTILGDLDWELTLSWFNVDVDVAGKLFGWGKTFNVWRFQNTESHVTLLERSLGGPLVLQ